ncbi:DUF1758 domain-containing protein [Trichonephila clavipes]|nr:DUF1758 domain-containing protein [Trichonephila clavipes]
MFNANTAQIFTPNHILECPTVATKLLKMGIIYMWHAAKSNAVFARRRIELKMKQKLLDIGAELEREKEERERRDIHQFAARLTANFQYYCSLRKVNSFESLCDLIISDKLFETLNKETATHIGIREAEDWFRPIDLAKECDIYISSKNGSHKETPITYGYTQDPFKNRSQNFKPKIKENYPQYLERENKKLLYMR